MRIAGDFNVRDLRHMTSFWEEAPENGTVPCHISFGKLGAHLRLSIAEANFVRRVFILSGILPDSERTLLFFLIDSMAEVSDQSMKSVYENFSKGFDENILKISKGA